MSALLDWAGVLSGPTGVLIGAYGTKIFNRRVNQKVAEKHDAEASQAIAIAATTLIAPLEKRVTALERENREAKTKLASAVRHIRELYAWISHHVPHMSPPQPPTELGV